MARGPPSPAVWVQLAQSLVARELVREFGLPERRAADLLGLAPSAVSQYLSGRRLGGLLVGVAGDDHARAIARAAAEELASHPEPSGETLRIVLETARRLAETSGVRPGPAPGPPETALSATDRRRLSEALRDRIALEQAAVAECMRLAQKSRDELTRSIFRQIAADSLRHAEIVASIQTYLDRGLHRPLASGVTRHDIEALLMREREAEAQGSTDPGSEFGGIMSVLWESMVSDERKHEELLAQMLASAFAPAKVRRPTGPPAPGTKPP
ncbi:MAG TPA: hypothetical protein VMG81_03800 [Thermoplasmata archaeon]|nr:hypothetical protein [Thermoplasmata archaeon]